MVTMKQKIELKINELQNEIQFSGTYFVKTKETEYSGSYGYANRSEKTMNQINTRFGIASGSKLFTAIAVCQLIEQGKLAFDTKLKDCLNIEFPNFDEQITIQQLLTHTSGIPDYFDEDEMDDYEELWAAIPMYKLRTLKDFLQLFQHKEMKFAPGETFHYNNAGYIILGLVVEQASGLVFSEYVKQFIFQKAGMKDSGYFEMDALPERVAIGYIKKPDGTYRTNVYSLPVKSASDGGAYITAKDMSHLWDALFGNQLLSKEMTDALLKPHVQINDDIYYGYGLYMKNTGNRVEKYILMGYDPGYNFRSVYYPDDEFAIVVCSNKSDGAFDVIREIESLIKQ